MKNYIEMSSVTHDKYRIYTNFEVVASFDLKSLGINSEDISGSLHVKINDELDENIVTIKYNNNIYTLTLNELMEHRIKKEE